MRSLLDRIDRYFFEPMAPTTLGAARIILFGLILWKSLSRAWWRLAEYPPGYLWRPAVPDLPYVTEGALIGVALALSAGALLGLLGIWTRLAALVCFVALYLINAIDGGIYDSGWLLFSLLLVVLCSRMGDAFGLRARRDPEPSWEYRWPLRVAQLSMIVVYLQNGVGKLADSGLAWSHPEVLASWYFFHEWSDTHYWEFGKLLARYPWFSRLGALGTLVLENGVALLPFLPALRWLFVPGLIGMHVTIGLTLNIWFTEYFPLLLLFFDWEPARRWLRRSVGRED